MNECHFCGYNCCDTMFCTNCGKIVPPTWQNFFVALGLENLFNIDHNDLRSRYYERLTLVHPDLFIHKSQQELDSAQKQSAYLNSAFQTLNQLWPRAEYIVMINFPDYQSVNISAENLSKITHIHEQLIEALPEQISDIKAQLQNHERMLVKEISNYLNNNEYKEAANILAQHRFIKRLASYK